MSCVVCKSIATDLAHIKSRGAGGGLEEWNTLRMCRMHHQEQHKRGFHYMANKYPAMAFALAEKGWEFIILFGIHKLRRRDAEVC
jgi:hypothetical protein